MACVMLSRLCEKCAIPENFRWRPNQFLYPQITQISFRHICVICGWLPNRNLASGEKSLCHSRTIHFAVISRSNEKEL